MLVVVLIQSLLPAQCGTSNLAIVQAMFPTQQLLPGSKLSILLCYEIHSSDGRPPQLVEDAVPIQVAVYERSKYKW
jgi:hypothetical protein